MNQIFDDINEFPRDSVIYLYGAGAGGQSLYKTIKSERKDITVLGFIDDFKSGVLDGLKLLTLQKAAETEFDLIVISSIHQAKLERILIDAGISRYAAAGMGLVNVFTNQPSISSNEVDCFYSSVRKETDNLFYELDIDTINPLDIVKEVEAYNIGWDISGLIQSVDLKNIFEQHLDNKITRLAIYPCSIFLESSLDFIKKYFDKIELFDDFRKGEVLGGLTIKGSDAMQQSDAGYDAYFITTRVAELKEHFLSTCVPRAKSIWINDIAIEILKEAKTENDNTTQLESILQKIEEAKNPLVFLGGKFYNNYTPTVKSLEEAGYDIFIISRVPEVSHTYPNPSYHLLPFENKYLLDINEMIEFCDKLNKGIVLLHSEGYLNPQFEGFKTLASNVYPTILMKKIKVKKIFFLYDLIKPFYKNFTYEKEFMKVYQSMLKASDGIILNSNTVEAKDFLKYSIGIDKPMMSFYRYNFTAKQKSAKLTDGFHIAMVGGFLDDVGDEMRTISKYVREILAQEIHVHYYASTYGAKEFKETLPEEQKPYFHLEKTIMDQYELIESVSKYHAGWMVHNTQKISNMISQANEQLFKDLLYMFMVTTVPSAILLFGVSGLPMILNRSMPGILSEYPTDSLVPIELSEVHNLKKVINDHNWKDLQESADRNAELFSTAYNNTRLIEFIDNI